jgi:hypothetical protein
MSDVPALYAGQKSIQFGPHGGFLTLTELMCAYYELKKENEALKIKCSEHREALICAELRENDLIDRMREGL